MEKILTNEQDKIISVQWDETNFILVQTKDNFVKTTIILNPKEMLDLITFAGELGERN